ncbi:MAG: hypothetical protein J0L62_01250 [Bacteroidetes bacterium]|nr:hypothetical protein [Bacteroidota bacterium]
MPYTLLEIVESVSTKLGGSYTEVHSNYLLRLPMESTDIQEVIVITIENQVKEPMLKYFSIAGTIKLEPELTEFLLRNNLGMDYGGFSLMAINNEENLVVYDSVPLATARIEDIIPSVQYITKLAYESKKRISSGLNPL